MSTRSDIVIVGAGPAGSATAILMARLGWKIDLLDRRDPSGFKLCTHAIMPAGVAVLDDLGILAAVEAAGATRWWGSKLWLNGVSVRAPLPHRRVRSPFGLSLRRHLLDPILLGLARNEPGVRVLDRWNFRSLLGSKNEVSGIRAVDGDGRQHELQARLVVGADGRHSQVARTAHLPAMLTPNKHEAWIAYIDGVPEDDRPVLEGYYWHGRSASFLPADSGLRVAGVMTPCGAWQPAEASERLLDSLRAFPPLRQRLSNARVLGTPVHVSSLHNLARTPWRRGVMLLGDAALQTDPAFGQGISWALQSAAAAAPSIDRYLRGEAARPAGAAISSAFRRPQFLAVFAGTSLLSSISPGSWVERLVAANAAAGPRSTAFAMRLGLSLATASSTPNARTAVATRFLEALTG